METGERLPEEIRDQVERYIFDRVIVLRKTQVATARKIKEKFGIEITQQAIALIIKKIRERNAQRESEYRDNFISDTLATYQELIPELISEYRRSKKPIEETEWRSVGSESEQELSDLTDDEIAASAQRGDKKTSVKIYKKKGRIGDSSQLRVANELVLTAGRLLGYDTKASKLKSLEKAADAMAAIADILGESNKGFDLKEDDQINDQEIKNDD